MRIKTALVLGGLCAFAGGCGPLANVTRTVSGEPAEYARGAATSDNKQSDKLAGMAWEQLRQANPEVPYSTDFAEGFKKGFADYLHAGSNGEPPSVPPARYGHADYESVQGRQAVLDWFRGFREGSVQAHASGLRPVAAVPASVILPTSLPPLPGPPAASAGPASTVESLPLPELLVSPSGDTPSQQPESSKPALISRFNR